jgi:transposase
LHYVSRGALGLTAAGIPATCIEARQAKAAMGAMPNKTDRNDARGIAQIIRTGWYREVHVRSPSCRSWRALLTALRMVINKRRDVENGVRALLREAGLKVGTPSRRAFAARVRELVADDPVLAKLAESLLSIIEVMTGEAEKLTKRALDEVRVEPTCRRLMTVPGVGPLTALAFRATIDRPDRFRKSRDVGAHLGLTPRRYQSGETDVQGRISRCGDELARTPLYEAAHSLLIRSSKWSALRAWGMNIAKRRGMARARVAVARKLAGYPAPHMDGRQRVLLGQASHSQNHRCISQGVPVSARRGRSRVVPVGTMGEAISLRVRNQRVAMPRRSRVRLRRLALLTPSRGGRAPTAKRSE